MSVLCQKYLQQLKDKKVMFAIHTQTSVYRNVTLIDFDDSWVVCRVTEGRPITPMVTTRMFNLSRVVEIEPKFESSWRFDHE